MVKHGKPLLLECVNIRLWPQRFFNDPTVPFLHIPTSPVCFSNNAALRRASSMTSELVGSSVGWGIVSYRLKGWKYLSVFMYRAQMIQTQNLINALTMKQLRPLTLHLDFFGGASSPCHHKSKRQKEYRSLALLYWYFTFDRKKWPADWKTKLRSFS